MAKKEIVFSRNPFDALLGDAKPNAKNFTQLSTETQPNKDTLTKDPPRKIEEPQVSMNSEFDRSQSASSKFRYGELRRRSSLPRVLLKKTFEITPDIQAYLNICGFQKRLYQNVLVQEIFNFYFSQPEQVQLIQDFKKNYPEKFKQMFSNSATPNPRPQ